MDPAGTSWNALMQYAFLRVFANDGRLDRNELEMLERIALRDGEVDDHERAILSRVLERARPEDLDDETRAAIEAFRARHAIP